MPWRSVKRRPSGDTSPESRSQALLRPLSLWFVLLAVVVVAAVAWPLTQWLYTIAGDDPGRKIDAVRTGLSVAAGTGGVFALLLAFRRQRSTELIAEQTRLASERDHEQRERVADKNEQDSLARRIGEQYSAAAQQLASEKAPVRLAGLYALDRIGEANQPERQAIVNLICAYLRMPFQPPSIILEGGAGESESSIFDDAEKNEELEVRLTAQEILGRRTRTNADGTLQTFWPGITLNLSRAVLVDFSLIDCRIQNLFMRASVLYGSTNLTSVDIHGRILMRECQFAGPTSFSNIHLRDRAAVVSCNFYSSDTSFNRLVFYSIAVVRDNTFPSNAKVDVLTDSINGTDVDQSFCWPSGCAIQELPYMSRRGCVHITNQEQDEKELVKWVKSLRISD